MKRRKSVKTAFKKLDDVPYELEEPVLIKMQKMEKGLKFILSNLDSPTLTIENAAKAAGFSKSYYIHAFKDYFGIPFSRFITKLRLREAARDIRNDHYPKGVGEKYMFTRLPSFTRAFRREFGISPNEFFYGYYIIPDMPLRDSVEGLDIRLEYMPRNAFSITGYAVPAPRGNDTYLMDSVAYPFTEQGAGYLSEVRNDAGDKASLPREKGHDDTGFPDDQKNRGGRKKAGVWWYDTDEKLKYLYAVVNEEFDSVMLPGDKVSEVEKVDPAVGTDDIQKVTQVIQGGNYAVFSYERPSDDSEIPLKSRILARYIFKEWVPVNHKSTDTLGFTYEIFDADRVYIYIPMLPGMDIGTELSEGDLNISGWAKYIDEHIKEDLTTESLARIAGYSPDNYRDVFQLYYGLTPSKYVLRRRLYLAREEFEKEDAGIMSGQAEASEAKQSIEAEPQNSEELERIAGAYNFTSRQRYLELYKEEFGKNKKGAEDDITFSGSSLDLGDYYESNIDQIKVQIKRIQNERVVLNRITESSESGNRSGILGLVSYWLRNDFDDFERIKDSLVPDGNSFEKVYIWGDDPSYENGKASYSYYIGGILNEGGDVPEGYVSEEIMGGKYAVFSTRRDTDAHDIEGTFIMMHRLAFGTWLQKNRFRVDITKRTFVRWSRGKFYFYVPLVG